MPSATVVLFGATSYLGQYVLDDLLARGYAVVAVTRNLAAGEILLYPWKDRIDVTTSDKLTAASNVTAVVNLAYVKGEMPHRLYRRNDLLMRRVHDATVRLGAARLVHVSTQAVFGYQFSEPPRPVRAVRRDGDMYVESKVHAELLLEELQSSARYRLNIVRPGNIVGEGSPVWTASLAQRLLDGSPVGVAGRDGYSNAAYAPNLASYIGLLVDAPVLGAEGIDRYHHFADLSALRWSAFIVRFAEAIGVAPVIAACAGLPSGMSLRANITSERLKKINSGPVGILARRSLARLDADDVMDRALFALKTGLSSVRDAKLSATLEDQVFLTILSSEYEFRSHVITGWTPPVEGDDAMDRMVRWITDAGFGIGSGPVSQETDAAGGNRSRGASD